MSFSTLEEIKVRLDEYDVIKDASGNDQIVFKETPKLDYKINVLIDKAKKDIIHYRRYPEYYTDEQIADDIEKQYHSLLVDLVLYDYTVEGMDFETNHSETGVNRTIVKRETILGKVISFCRVL